MGFRLEGPALEFYDRQIGVNVTDWQFEHAILTLESQFLPLTLHEQAKKRFDKWRQLPDEDILTAYRWLKVYSDAMLYEAGPYEMKFRFYHGIHTEIRAGLARDDCTLEKPRWKQVDMLKHAINIEAGLNKAKPQCDNSNHLPNTHDQSCQRNSTPQRRKDNYCKAPVNNANHNQTNEHQKNPPAYRLND